MKEGRSGTRIPKALKPQSPKSQVPTVQLAKQQAAYIQNTSTAACQAYSGPQKAGK